MSGRSSRPCSTSSRASTTSARSIWIGSSVAPDRWAAAHVAHRPTSARPWRYYKWRGGFGVSAPPTSPPSLGRDTVSAVVRRAERRRAGFRGTDPLDALNASAGLAEFADPAQNPSANLASSLIRSGVQGGEKVIVGCTSSTPASSDTNSSICSETCGPDRAAGAGQRVGDPDRAILDLDVVDQAKLDEIEPQLGVDHVAESLGYVFYGGHVSSVYENSFASLLVMARFR